MFPDLSKEDNIHVCICANHVKDQHLDIFWLKIGRSIALPSLKNMYWVAQLNLPLNFWAAPPVSTPSWSALSIVSIHFLFFASAGRHCNPMKDTHNYWFINRYTKNAILPFGFKCSCTPSTTSDLPHSSLSAAMAEGPNKALTSLAKQPIPCCRLSLRSNAKESSTNVNTTIFKYFLAIHLISWPIRSHAYTDAVAPNGQA